MSILTEIAQILTGAITTLGTGIGEGLNSTVNAMFIQTVEGAQKLSTWGIVVVVFAGIGLAVGLTRLVFYFVTSLGGKGV